MITAEKWQEGTKQQQHKQFERTTITFKGNTIGNHEENNKESNKGVWYELKFPSFPKESKISKR